jgi:hypothetical protein
MFCSCVLLKHRFIAGVKRCVIPDFRSVGNNQEVIDVDNKLSLKERAARIREAIDQSEHTRAEIARRTDNTAQAVNGWCQTGRISKENLDALAALTKTDRDFFLYRDFSKSSLSAQAAKLARDWIALPATHRSMVRRYLDDVLVMVKAEPPLSLAHSRPPVGETPTDFDAPGVTIGKRGRRR